MTVIENRLADLVHESVRGDSAEAASHRHFIVSRVAMGIVALACIPLYLALRGAPSAPEYVAIACVIAPLFAAIILARTGRLALAHVLSASAFTGLIVCIAGSSGGIGSAATVWLVAVPLEALLSGSRRASVGATLVAGAGMLVIVVLDALGIYPLAEIWPAALAAPIFALTAIAHAGWMVVAVSRNDVANREAIRLHQAQDRSLLQIIDDLVLWHDRNGHVLKASPASMKLLGVPATSLHERGFLARVHVQDRPAYLKTVSDAAVGNKPISIQFRLLPGDAAGDRAGVLWVEMRAYRIDAADGEPWAVVAVLRDISEQKRYEEDLELARVKAERADVLKSRFLATVSHELRTPLNAIIGFSEILSADGMSHLGADQRRGYAKIVHDSGHHLLDVVNSLLDLSKIESGNFDFTPAPFAVAPLVEGCFDLMRLKAEGVGVSLTGDIEPNLPELVADRRACRQVLINLISNAVKFTPPGGKVTVALRRVADRFILTVADTGVGVAEADLAKLGRPFFQVNSTYDRSHEGTGLGLSVVRGLVGLHRGSMTIESSVGEGTCVTVELPADCRLVPPSATPLAAIPIRTLARRRLGAGSLNEEMKQSA